MSRTETAKNPPPGQAVGFTMSGYLMAQQPRIPTLQVCNKTLVKGDIYITFIEQVTTTGKHTPTVYLNGRCKVKSEGGEFKVCRFWMMIADNN
jgi:hypothetical protein